MYTNYNHVLSRYLFSNALKFVHLLTYMSKYLCVVIYNFTGRLFSINYNYTNIVGYRHPLFPLMETLYIKCEQATETTECADAETISNIIHTFLEQRSKKQSILLRNRQSPQPDDADTDELVSRVCFQ